MEPVNQDAIDLFDKLSETERTQVLEFTSITSTDDINRAVGYLQMFHFNLNEAVSLYWEDLERNQVRNFHSQAAARPNVGTPDSLNYDPHEHDHQQDINLDPSIAILAQQLVDHFNLMSAREENILAANPAGSRNQSQRVEEYRLYLREKERRERENGGFKNSVKSGFKSVGRLLSKVYNNIIPIKLRGEVSDAERFYQFKKSFGNFNTFTFEYSNLEEALTKAEAFYRPLLVMIFLHDPIFLDLQLALMKDPQIISLLNNQYLVLGILATSTEAKSLVSEVPSSNWPCFAAFRLDIFQKRHLIEILNTEPKFYLNKLKAIKNEFNRLLQEEDKIKKEYANQERARAPVMPNPFQDFLMAEGYHQPRPQPQITPEQRQRIEQDRMIRAQQELEFQEAQKQAEQQIQRKREEEEALKMEAQRKIEEERKLLERKEVKKRELPAEPAESHPEAICISFRCPNGKKLTRWFLSSMKIEVFYDFIDAQDDIGFEVKHAPFDLIQTFPMLNLSDKKEMIVGEIFKDSKQEVLHVKECS